MLQHFPLTYAYLCQDCNSIGNSAKQCPACASTVLMSLAGVLNRTAEEKRELQLHSMAALAVTPPRKKSALAA